jgi:hypothetical protein
MTPIPNPQSPIPVSRSSVSAWLLARRPEPPADLATKLAASVESAPDTVLAGGSVAAVMGALGTWLLGVAVERQETAHDAALDLLAADAFLTYAFEAASEEGGDVAGLAGRLLAQVHA